MAAAKRSLFLIMGAPGGGKGTIAKYIVRDYAMKHVSTGDLLRSEISSGKNEEAAKYVNAGKLVPDDIAVDLVVKALKGMEGRILLDGFPRTVPQAKRLSEEVQQVEAVLNLNVPHDVIVERISNRWIHKASGRTYAYDFNPPRVEGKDDVTGEPLEQRDDDKPEVVKERLATYEKVTMPLVTHYASIDKDLIYNFVGTESPVIYQDVEKVLDRLLK